MAECYRIIFESYDDKSPKKTLTRKSLIDGKIEKPTSILDFSISHKKQIELLQKSGDSYLEEKLKLGELCRTCSHCQGDLTKLGKNTSTFNDVFTDHKITMQRLKCRNCGKEEPSTVRTLLNGVQSAELMKIQSELGSKHTFRECEDILRSVSSTRRQINVTVQPTA